MEKKSVHVHILQASSGLGPGQFERAFRVLKSLHSDDIAYDKKTQIVRYKPAFDTHTQDFEVKTDWESEL